MSGPPGRCVLTLNLSPSSVLGPSPGRYARRAMALDDRLDLYEVKAQFERFTEWLDLGEIVADLGFLRRARRTLLPLPLIDGPVPIDPSAHLQPFRSRP